MTQDSAPFSSRPRKIVIIANPVSGGGRALRAIRRHIRQWPHPDWNIEVLTTRSPDHAGSLARQLLEDPPDVLGVCGGDGTLNEVASRIPDPPFPVAVIPAGTANVIARELGLPLGPVAALEAALGGEEKRVDLGELGPRPGRRFLIVAGVGFDAYVVSKVRPGLKAATGMAAYAAAILGCLQSYPFPEFQVALGGRTYTATSCLLCNARSYGGGLLFCPEADMSDGFLDVLIVQGARRMALAWFLLRAWLGKADSPEWVLRVRADSLKLSGRKGIPVHADGELVAGFPPEIRISPRAFPLVLARKT